MQADLKNIAQINATGLSDVPTDKDSLGFLPYTRAIAWFLSNEKTKPPLTISVEGPWGCGKSSFMLQLQKQLEERNTEFTKYFIRFNAWRSDKDEALWAAFALTFIKQLEPRIPIIKRLIANVELLRKRLDWKRGWFQLAQIVMFWAAFLVLTIYGLWHLDEIKDLNTHTIAIGVSWLAAGYFGLEKAKRIFGNPLSYDLSKYIRNLKYEEKIAFIERFQDDFADIVKSYVGEKGRIFIFIDDLDRCEIPRAAELLQAINLLLSADEGNLFFVLGLDREMVAAGIAAKNEKILPYLAAGRAAAKPEDYHRVGVEYGSSFMEKFIQVPFRVPRPDEREIAGWVAKLIDIAPAEQQASTAQLDRRDAIGIRLGADPEEFEQVVEKLVVLFGFNPRRVKQFVNIFRLRVMVALSTGVLVPAPRDAAGGKAATGVTVQQIGLFTAILMQWPRLAGDLMEEPNLLNQITSVQNQPESGAAEKWASNEGLRKAVDIDPPYSLRGVDLRPLLMIMPDARPGIVSDNSSERQRTRLIAGAEVEEIPEANVTPTQNTSSRFEQGPTGPRFETKAAVAPTVATGSLGPSVGTSSVPRST